MFRLSFLITPFFLFNLCIPIVFAEPDLLAERWTAVAAEEWALQQAFSQIRENRQGVSELVPRLNRALSGLSPEERESLLKVRSFKQLPEPLRLKLAPLMTDLEAADGGLQDLQSRYDRLSLEKISLILNQYRAGIEQVAEEAGKGLPQDRRRQLEELRQGISDRVAAFDAAREKPDFEFTADNLRELRSTLTRMDEFFSMAARPHQNWKQWLSDLWQGASRVRSLLPLIAYSSPELGATAYRLLRERPAIEGLYPGLLRAGRWTGHEYRLLGERNLPQSREGVATFIAPAHTHAGLDMISNAQMGLQDLVVFTTAKMGVDFVREKAAAAPEAILVGQGTYSNTPVQQFFEKWEAGKRTYVVLPEGNQPTGLLMETRPAHSNFEALMKVIRLKGRGMGLEVVPVSSPDNYRPWYDLNPLPGDPKRLTTVVHEPLSPELVSLALISDRPGTLSRLIRQHWLDAAVDYGPSGRVLGTLTGEGVSDMVRSRLLPPHRCVGPLGQLK